MITASVLALSRWYQISYPLRVFHRNIAEMILGICCLLLLINFQFSLNESFENPAVFKMNVQTVTYLKRENFKENLPFLLVLLFTFVSNIASVITVWSIFKSPAVTGNEILRARRIKSALKIALLNVGNLVWDGIIIFRVLTSYGSEQFYIVQTILSFMPILQSTYNPIVYTLLTGNLLKTAPRREK